MTENQDMLLRLEALLRMKKSKSFYAARLGITEQEVDELLKELRERDQESNETLKAPLLCETIRKVNNEKGTIESTLILDFEPKWMREMYDQLSKVLASSLHSSELSWLDKEEVLALQNWDAEKMRKESNSE
jgi:ATP-dependent RNA circularization protein (DNA/RNA ligase family)